jgi:hypothetical protein
MSTSKKFSAEESNKRIKWVRNLQAKREANCKKHEYILTGSLWGGSNDAMCQLCYKTVPIEEFKRLKIEDLEKEIEIIRK